MRFAAVAVLACTASFAAAQSEPEFWWAYPPANYTTEEPAKYGYDPAFSVCGSSCANCSAQVGRTEAKQCFSTRFTNICYEPSSGETCCKDIYGTACVDGYYCAYNNTNAAVCCANDRNVEDCGNLFDLGPVTTRADSDVPSTVVVTEVRTPTAASESNSSGVSSSKPDPSAPAQTGGLNSAITGGGGGGGLSVGAKVGIAIGAFVVAVAAAAAVAFLILRRRRAAKYGAVQAPPPAGQHFPPAVPTSYASPAPTTYAQPAPYGGYAPPPKESAYEPMRMADQPNEYYKHSPPPGVAMPHYADNPAPQQQGTPMAEMPGANTEVHEMPSQTAEKPRQS